ncbi:hypothetical protein E1161_21605 [Saccharopolyspora aridisoli]|uniref:DNA2/NAM7 helicase helicase domain-containing protein n=1 Tax=Saccharopolyspora aridisoli TaxID=2530385 RepID=A0A4R4UJT6_9PSEU|nr:AAA domain-containing protein [Saccharopolyspora aridisoli]TDC89294.1 hypothetical protein E1161_21605 [Saccharopolyspora aridisoli]
MACCSLRDASGRPAAGSARADDYIHPGSALGAYLTGSPIETRELAAPPIYPFRCNLSQRAAVENALTCSVSIFERPPGTGKTETILNLIANIAESTPQGDADDVIRASR